jgi:hypothetical protein
VRRNVATSGYAIPALIDRPAGVATAGTPAATARSSAASDTSSQRVSCSDRLGFSIDAATKL